MDKVIIHKSRDDRTEIEIWTAFGPVGSTEKNIWADYEQLLRAIISCFHGQKIYYSLRTKKLHNIYVF